MRFRDENFHEQHAFVSYKSSISRGDYLTKFMQTIGCKVDCQIFSISNVIIMEESHAFNKFVLWDSTQFPISCKYSTIR